MLTATPTQRAALREFVRLVTVVDIKIGSTWYYISNSDVGEQHNGNTYQPGYLIETDDIEITSSPKVDDTNITIDGTDQVFIGLFLSQQWMNNEVRVTQLKFDRNNDLIMSKVAFEGLISEVEISTDSPYEVIVTVSSIWKDFEKQSGIKTNATSQKRHYPTDTGFEHTARATKSIPWGKAGNGKSIIYRDTPKFTLPANWSS